MAEEIKVSFQAKNPSDIKFLHRLYEEHLVLNDLGVRMDQQMRDDAIKELTVPTQDDVHNLIATFKKAVATFTDITNKYGDVNHFAANFYGKTNAFARSLILEIVDFNNGMVEIDQTKGGLANYDDDKLNDWINKMMNDVVETNKAFKYLINNNR